MWWFANLLSLLGATFSWNSARPGEYSEIGGGQFADDENSRGSFEDPHLVNVDGTPMIDGTGIDIFGYSYGTTEDSFNFAMNDNGISDIGMNSYGMDWSGGSSEGKFD